MLPCFRSPPTMKTGDVIDYGTNHDSLAVLQSGTLGNVDDAFVTLQHSVLARFAGITGDDQTLILPIRRTKRYLRAVLAVERPDEETASTVPLTCFLAQ